jgi:hypothetical protein
MSEVCTVELYGVARQIARIRSVSLPVVEGATLSEILSALADELPSLVGRVIAPDRLSLTTGYACNVNGLAFVRDATAAVSPGDSLIIVSADAGG